MENINNFWDELFKPENRDVRNLILKELGSKGRRGLGATAKNIYELLGGKEQAIKDYIDANMEYVELLKDVDYENLLNILRDVQEYKQLANKESIKDIIYSYNKDNNLLITILYLLKNKNLKGNYYMYIWARKNKLPQSFINMIIDMTFTDGAKYFYIKMKNGMFLESINQLIDTNTNEDIIVEMMKKYGEKFEKEGVR
jgi:hypothetical protein